MQNIQRFWDSRKGSILPIFDNPITFIPLAFGIVSFVTLTVAITTDYWLITWDEGPDPNKGIHGKFRLSFAFVQILYLRNSIISLWFNFSLRDIDQIPFWVVEKMQH